MQKSQKLGNFWTQKSATVLWDQCWNILIAVLGIGLTIFCQTTSDHACTLRKSFFDPVVMIVIIQK
jgi:hypothetical protein